MNTTEKATITVAATINAPVEKVWNLWTEASHIMHWNNASDDWHTPKAENYLEVGGKFLSRMEAKDGSSGFDFTGTYSRVEPPKQIDYTLDDGRKVQVWFAPKGNETTVTETFEAEEANTLIMQQTGWQAILDNFKKYAESYGKLERLHFEITIHASVNKVYKTMLDEKTFVVWTAEFNPTSRFEGSWEKGSKILFLGTDQNGKLGGMVSRIQENIPNQFVSIVHYGIVQNGNEVLSGPDVEGWAGSLENYSFSEVNGTTLLSVDMDSNLEFKKYFQQTWPKALLKLKNICES